MSRIKDDIRRIAGSEELKKYIESILNGGDVTEREAIGETYYTAYVDSDDSISGNPNANPNSNLEKNGSEAQQNTDANNANNGAGSGDLDGLKNTDNGTSDLNDLANTLPKIGDKLNGLDGLQDCSTGDVANLRMDGEFIPPVMTGYTGYNADWATNGDPRESNFVAGTWYSYAGVPATYATSPYQSVAAYLPTWDSLDPPRAPHSVGAVADWDPATDSTVTVTVNQATGGSFDVNVTVNTTGCTIGVDSYCPSEAPINEWPSDDTHQLVYDGAQFLTNQFESGDDVIPQFGNDYQSGPSKVSGCTSGGTNVSVEAANNGGWILNIESGANSGKSVVADANGNVVAVTSDTTPYLPGS